MISEIKLVIYDASGNTLRLFSRCTFAGDFANLHTELIKIAAHGHHLPLLTTSYTSTSRVTQPYFIIGLES